MCQELRSSESRCEQSVLGGYGGDDSVLYGQHDEVPGQSHRLRLAGPQVH